MDHFDHEKLDVYQRAVDFVVVADGIVENLPEVEPTWPTNSIARRPRFLSTSRRARASLLPPRKPASIAWPSAPRRSAPRSSMSANESTS